MNTSSFVRPVNSNRFAPAGFTLIELLVVISIIAVLAGLLLPVVSSVQDNAKKVSAKSTIMQIVSAIKSYQTDYGVYPPPSPGTAATTTTTDTTYLSTTNYQLFAILTATDAMTTSPNTRRIVYFEGKNVKIPTVPRDGFATAQATTTIKGSSFPVPIGTLVDPWGVGYMVRYDTGYDNAVLLPELEGNIPSTTSDSSSATSNANGTTPTNVIRFGVIAWSYGKDGQAGMGGNFGNAPGYTYYDDVVSWQ